MTQEPDTDAYLHAQTERHYRPLFEYGDWYADNEDKLLANFLEEYEGIVVIPPVKEWTPEITRLWEDFCNKAWEEACDAYAE